MSRDVRQYSRQTYRRLILGGLILLFGVGGGLIAWLYGIGGMALGWICLLVGLLPVVLIVFFLALIDWIRKRAGYDD